MTDTPEARLRAFALRRHESDFRALYEMTAPQMLGLATRLTGGDRAAAEDIVQEAWFRATDRVDRYIAPGPVISWLNGFVVRCWSERRRRDQREESADERRLDALAPATASPWSDAPLLLRAVHALPDGYRAVLVLHDIEGYTHAEIAARLDIQEGTSKSQLARARRHLRALLGVSDAAVHTGSSDAE